MKGFHFRKAEDPMQAARKKLKQDMETDELAFLAAIDRQVQRRNRALRSGNAEKALGHSESLSALMDCYQRWRHDSMIQAVLMQMLTTLPKTEEPTASKYLVDSLFLSDCYHFLMQEGISQRPGALTSEPEWACAVTGPRLGLVRLLDQRVVVKITYQSADGIRLSVDGLQRALVDLQQAGHVLHAVFHSHRMRGADGSWPSKTDLDTQEHILEAAYPAIQAIFTEDGYIRFFSWKRPFRIDVYGKGVEHVEGTLYKLQQVGVPAAMAGEPVSNR